MPSYRKMTLDIPKPLAVRGGAFEQRGFAIYTQHCASCHGPGQTQMRSPGTLGANQFRTLLRQGREQMRAFTEQTISAESVDALEAYLLTLPEEESGGASVLRLPPNPNRYQGPEKRYSGSFSAGWYTSEGYPAVAPPWTQLVAYDLNEGTIKWRVPDGHAPGLAARGIFNTGTVRPRNGPVVTGGGLIFLPNSQDRTIRVFDKDSGRVLWERELEANPEGIPAVYQVRGRQYVAFAAGASWGTGGDPVWRNPLHRKQGRIEAQGYHVFALRQHEGHEGHEGYEGHEGHEGHEATRRGFRRFGKDIPCVASSRSHSWP